MKYVLDSSVALKWVLHEADSGKAIRLRDDYSNGIHELLAPDIFRLKSLMVLLLPNAKRGSGLASRQSS
jgi:hypothetical protein